MTAQAFEIHPFRIAFVKVVDEATSIKSQRCQQLLHRDVGLIRRCEQFGGAACINQVTDQRRSNSLTAESRMDIEHFDPTVVVELVVQDGVGHDVGVDDGDVTRTRFDLVVDELDACRVRCRDVIESDDRICIRLCRNSQFHGSMAYHIMAQISSGRDFEVCRNNSQPSAALESLDRFSRNVLHD